MTDDTARLLEGLSKGDRECIDGLIEHLYDDLRSIAARVLQSERPGLTLQPTALVNEAYLRMVQQRKQDLRDRLHFFAVAATIMRRVLIDHARKRAATKRGGRSRTLVLSEEFVLSDCTDPLDLLAFDEVLENLAQLNARHARIVELRYFAGLSIEETAQALAVSPATIKNDWRVARAWLSTQLS